MKANKQKSKAEEIIKLVADNGGEIELEQLKQEYIENCDKVPNIIIPTERYADVLLGLTINEIGLLFNCLLRLVYNGEDINPTEDNKTIMPLLKLLQIDIENNFEKYKRKAANVYATNMKKARKKLDQSRQQFN